MASMQFASYGQAVPLSPPQSQKRSKQHAAMSASTVTTPLSSSKNVQPSPKSTPTSVMQQFVYPGAAPLATDVTNQRRYFPSTPQDEFLPPHFGQRVSQDHHQQQFFLQQQQQQQMAAFYQQQQQMHQQQLQQQLLLQQQEEEAQQQKEQQPAQRSVPQPLIRRPRSRSRTLSQCAAQESAPMSPRTFGATSTMVELAQEKEPLWAQLNQSMHNFIDTTVATTTEKLSESDVDVIRRAFLAGARNGIEMGDDLITDVDALPPSVFFGGMREVPQGSAGPMNLGILIQAAQTVASFRPQPERSPQPIKRNFSAATTDATNRLESAVFKRLRSAMLAR